jgi:hypothetical protein
MLTAEYENRWLLRIIIIVIVPALGLTHNCSSGLEVAR